MSADPHQAVARLAGCALIALSAIGCSFTPSAAHTGKAPIATQDATEQLCDCTLRSWVVAGKGRHLFLEIDCPPSFDDLDTVVEFGAASQRADWQGRPTPNHRPRVTMITKGLRLRPPFGEPDNRIETEFQITQKNARTLQRDRVWEIPYALLGTNSTSGMRRAFEDAGIDFPAHIIENGGMLGEFPGVRYTLGEEIPPAQWAEFGLIVPND